MELPASRAIRVLWVTERFPPHRGGVAAAAARLVRGLAPHLGGLDVLLLDADVPPARVDVREWEGVAVHRLGRTDRDEESLQLLAEVAHLLCVRQGIDLLHGFYAVPAGYVATLTGRRVGRPAVVSLRGNDVDRGTFQGHRAFALDWTLRNAAALTAVSRELGDKVRALGGRRDGVHFIGNAVNPEVFRPGPVDPAVLGDLRHRPRPWIAFAGELRFKKGLPLLLDLAEDRARRGGTVFLLGGVRHDERAAVEQWRRSRPLAAACLCAVPWSDDHQRLVDLYRLMDLFVFPSLWDGQPNALLEVMACGRPALGSAAGGIADLLDDGRTGWVLPLDRLDHLADEVERILGLSAEAREAVGRSARQYVVEEHHPGAEIAAYLEVYRGAVAEGAAQP